MKALDLLKVYKTIDFGCDMLELHKEIDEAISEVEAMQKRITELEETMKPKTCDGCTYDNNGRVYPSCEDCCSEKPYRHKTRDEE